MANTNAPFGLRPVNGLTGGPYTGRIGRYYTTDGTAAYIGSLVKPSGTADADGVMAVTSNLATGAAVVGAVVGVEPVTSSSTIYKEATTNRYVYVADDPNALFVVQDNGASALTATVIANSCDLTSFTTGSTVTGLSSTVISTAAVTASGDGTEDVLIMGLLQRADNAFGTYAKYIVRLNNHFYVDASPGA
jgi:hypothetical protein